MSLKHPFSALVVGPSGSGKTQFVVKLIKNAGKVIDPPPERIVWCYSVFQNAYEEFPQIEFIEGLPNISIFDGKQRVLLILDDLMEKANDDRITQIFTKHSHHLNISVLFLTQNLFFKGTRTISLNTNYFILFKNVRDTTQIGILGRQMFGNKSHFLTEAYRDATSKPYSYLFLDMKPDTDEEMRVRSGIFPLETQYAYIPK